MSSTMNGGGAQNGPRSNIDAWGEAIGNLKACLDRNGHKKEIEFLNTIELKEVTLFMDRLSRLTAEAEKLCVQLATETNKEVVENRLLPLLRRSPKYREHVKEQLATSLRQAEEAKRELREIKAEVEEKRGLLSTKDEQIRKLTEELNAEETTLERTNSSVREKKELLAKTDAQLEQMRKEEEQLKLTMARIRQKTDGETESKEEIESKKRRVSPQRSSFESSSFTTPEPTDSHIQEPLTFGAEARSAAQVGTSPAASSSSSSSTHQKDQGSTMKTDEQSGSWKDLFKFKKRNSPDSK